MQTRYGGWQGQGGHSQGRGTGGNAPDGYAAPPASSSPGVGARGAPGAGPPRSGSGGPSGGGGCGAAKAPSMLTVGGCSNATVASIIQGTFSGHGANHGKPVYKKEGAAGSVHVLIYYWDERDGPNFSGWWFGPKVGGDQVWAYNSNKSTPVPPTSGWRVPWDGPVDDQLRVVFGGGGGASASMDSRGMSMTTQPRESRQRHDDEDRRRREKERIAEEQRRSEQEARRRQEEELRLRRQEEDRRRREEEERQRSREREEEQRRREAEARKRREEEELRKRETAAALPVQKVIQRVRIATPETYDSLRAELAECLAEKLEAMGSLGSKVSEEAEQTLKKAQRRIDEINEKRIEDQRRKEEEERKRREETERVEKVMVEAAQQLKEAEGKVEEVEKRVKNIPEGKEATPESIVEAVDQAGQAYEPFQAEVDKTAEWFASKKSELTENHASRSVVMEFSEMQDKLEQGRKTVAAAAAKAKTAREKAARKAVAMKKETARRELFEKQDLDKDGKLSREEAATFGKEVHGFELQLGVLNKIMATLEPITFEKFHSLHQKVAIAKLEAEARAKRAKLEAERASFQKVVDEASALLTQAEANVGQAETDAKPLTRDVELPAVEIKQISEAAQSLVAKAAEQLQMASKGLEQAAADSAANKALNFDSKDWLHLQERTQTRLDRVATTVKKAFEEAVLKAALEIDKKLTEWVLAARKHMSSQEKTGEQLFADLAAGGETLNCEKFVAFAKGLEGLAFADDGEAERLFAHIVGKSDASMGRDRFLDMLRLYYKCVKSTILNEEISIKTKTLRRLELGEMLESIEGPSVDKSCSVQRVKCKAMSDDQMGWVTLQGNQGTPFLMQEGNFISVGEKLAAEKKVAEEKLAAKKAAEQKAAEQKAAEEKLAEEKLAEEKLAEEKMVEEKAAQEKSMQEAAAEKQSAEDLPAKEPEEETPAAETPASA